MQARWSATSLGFFVSLGLRRYGLCPGNVQSIPTTEKNRRRLSWGPRRGYPVWQSHLGSVYGPEGLAARDLANRRQCSPKNGGACFLNHAQLMTSRRRIFIFILHVPTYSILCHSTTCMFRKQNKALNFLSMQSMTSKLSHRNGPSMCDTAIIYTQSMILRRNRIACMSRRRSAS